MIQAQNTTAPILTAKVITDGTILEGIRYLDKNMPILDGRVKAGLTALTEK
ncbi:hypothetical protein [Chryseobacterium sp. MP_3.2]|uniref:hypothetical protein n=1 Tax=Chryseobacterium sp. MP_3.2 TaxID=3071712 RepID=UPI002E05E736|nr:hypothetical protein [Chryseobacterium sp. MP_3.2]